MKKEPEQPELKKDPPPDPPAATDPPKPSLTASAETIAKMETDLAAAKAAHATLEQELAVPPTPFKSDEGIDVARYDAEHLVNLQDPKDEQRGEQAKRFELHVGGLVYSHVAENAAGQWLYRYTK